MLMTLEQCFRAVRADGIFLRMLFVGLDFFSGLRAVRGEISGKPVVPPRRRATLAHVRLRVSPLPFECEVSVADTQGTFATLWRLRPWTKKNAVRIAFIEVGRRMHIDSFFAPAGAY